MKKPTEKIKVKKIQENTIFYEDVSYSIEEIKLLFNKLIDEGWQRCSFNQTVDVTLSTDREETDEEFNQRITEYEIYKKWEKERRIKTEQDERKTYERLKKKYEPLQ